MVFINVFGLKHSDGQITPWNIHFILRHFPGFPGVQAKLNEGSSNHGNIIVGLHRVLPSEHSITGNWTKQWCISNAS